MQTRNKQKHKTKGDGFYHKRDEKSHERHKGKQGEEDEQQQHSDDEQVPRSKSPERQAVAAKSNKATATHRVNNKKSTGEARRERHASQEAAESASTGGAKERDDVEDEDDGVERRQMTLAMTRSGAINTLSSKFLRDSDEAVQRRKVLAPLPFEHKEITPRIYCHLPFPVRQDWSNVKSPEELEELETKYFDKWLDETYNGKSIDHLSPFEHNLEVWRQLWRVLEKSDVIVLTADIRDPLLHVPVALHKHVTRVHKLPMLIVLTKCDLVSEEHVAKWKRFLLAAFDSKMTRVVANSGKCQSTHGIGGYSARRKILHARATQAQIAEMHRQSRLVLDTAMDLAREHRPELDVVKIGIVGQPNTGKSSLVNAILGRHAVSVSRTCGHTKHWQTQNIKNTDDEVIATVIDSPGIIFPMVVDDSNKETVSPRAWYECSGLYPIAQIRETYSAVRFSGERIDLPRMYNLKLNEDDYGEHWSPYAFCGCLADKRGYTLQMGGGAPDMHRAGLETIYDICDGIILLCFPPPDIEEWREKTREEAYTDNDDDENKM